LAALLGKDAAGLSATNITRLTNEWETEYRAFQKRSLADREYVYVWVDGVHFNVRLDDDRLCTLVMIGVRPDGTKELIAVEDGYRESAESWKTVLRDLKRRGMRAPLVAVGDGALGFLGRRPRRLAEYPRAAGLGPQARQHPRQAAPTTPAARKAAIHEVMYAETRDEARGAISPVRRRVRGQGPEGCHDAGAGGRNAAYVLRLPRRALEAPSDVERNRVPVRNRAAPPARDEGGRLTDEGPADGLQAPRYGAGPVAAAGRRALAPAR